MSAWIACRDFQLFEPRQKVVSNLNWLGGILDLESLEFESKPIHLSLERFLRHRGGRVGNEGITRPGDLVFICSSSMLRTATEHEKSDGSQHSRLFAAPNRSQKRRCKLPRKFAGLRSSSTSRTKLLITPSNSLDPIQTPSTNYLSDFLIWLF